jgi:hypothetical protein
MPFHWDMIGAAVALIGAIVLAIIVLQWVKGWTKTPDADSKEEEASTFRQMLDKGLLSGEEYARIQAALERKKQIPKPPAEKPPDKPEERFFDPKAREGIQKPEANPPIEGEKKF